LVGNDVVDLADAEIAEHHRRERFVARVCAPAERDRVRSAGDLWTLFAAKEAAYKALVKLGHAPGFEHRAIVVAPDLGSVAWHGHRLRLQIERDEQSVHAVAWSGDLAPLAALRRPDDGEEQAARRLACALAARTAGCEVSGLVVVRDPVAGAWDGYGAPYVERAGLRLAVDVSLSHDGRYVAAAAVSLS
jgi:phosphopantetheinyl transferase (holo-ACP synthase)